MADSRLEKTVAAFGGWDAWNRSLPKRLWVQGANGLWHSMDKSI